MSLKSLKSIDSFGVLKQYRYSSYISAMEDRYKMHRRHTHFKECFFIIKLIKETNFSDLLKSRLGGTKEVLSVFVPKLFRSSQKPESC